MHKIFSCIKERRDNNEPTNKPSSSDFLLLRNVFILLLTIHFQQDPNKATNIQMRNICQQLHGHKPMNLVERGFFSALNSQGSSLWINSSTTY